MTDQTSIQPFVDFGRKTQFSVKNAMGDTKSALPILKERKQGWFAVSDYGECSGWVQQYFTCVKNGIVPILGMETFVNNYRFSIDEGNPENVTVRKMGETEEWEKSVKEVSDDELDWSQIDFPIDIFMRRIEGYTNIISIHNDAQINGVDKRPRTTDAFLKRHGAGIVALMPTPYSEISSHVFNGNEREALAKYKFYKSVFDDVYVEVPLLEDEEYREINASTIAFCKRHGIPMVPVINAHYDTIDDEDAFPIFRKCGALRGGMSYEVDYAPNMYMKTCGEVHDTFRRFHQSDVFTEEVFDELMMNLGMLLQTFKTVELDTSPKTPHFENSDQLLREHAWEGFRKCGFDQKPNADEYKSRLEYELKNIIGAGFADYFLLIEQMFEWHINQMHRLGSVGRGSAAGSLVLRCLGVTKIDPVHHNLLFERFLDASRLDDIVNKGGKVSGADFPDVDCFSMHTLVISENGIKEIKDVVEGEMVMTRDGSYHPVEKIVDYRNAPVVRVVYGDWYFDCTPNHRVLVKRNDSIEYRYVYELKRGDCLVENETTFISIEEICQEKLVKMVRDLKIEGQHCFRVCGRAYNRVLTKDGNRYYLSDKELECARNNVFSHLITSENILEALKNQDTEIHDKGVVVHNSDFQSNAKEGVKDFFAEHYGKDNICSVGTVGYLHVKSTLKELGRVYGIDDKAINDLTTVGLAEFEADDDGLPLEELCEKFPALNKFLEQYPQMAKVFKKLQGTINCWGVHAGGILISDKPLTTQLPVRVNKGKLASCWSEGLNGRELGEMGFLKLDLLAIETLDIIEDAFAIIHDRHPEERRGFDEVMEIMVNDEEPQVLNRIESGWTQGVFQFETPLALRVCKDMSGLKTFDDIGSLSTLMRPAALQNKFPEKYGRRRNNQEEYFIPDCMKQFLNKEYGMPIYQEGAYFFGMYMAGMDKVMAYKWMKVLYKGKLKSLEDIELWHDKFINGCLKKIKHDEYDLEFENGEKRHFTEFDKLKCTDGQEHTVKEIVENGLEVDEEAL